MELINFMKTIFYLCTGMKREYRNKTFEYPTKFLYSKIKLPLTNQQKAVKDQYITHGKRIQAKD